LAVKRRAISKRPPAIQETWIFFLFPFRLRNHAKNFRDLPAKPRLSALRMDRRSFKKKNPGVKYVPEQVFISTCTEHLETAQSLFNNFKK
jgi:hypothetical protein